MKGIKFLNNPQSYNPDDAFIAHFSEINNEDELFEQLSEKLLFPDYFGFNWNAVNECLNDLQWIEQRKIVLVHNDIPKLLESEMAIYLDVLGYAVKNWQNFRDRLDWQDWIEHDLEIVFPESSKNLIKKVFELTNNCFLS